MTEYQSFLLKLNRNLNTLRERESKYGGNAPLELLNQIEDHQQAIALTEQALEGEITEVEWKETTKHLLAFSGGQVINIEAETYVAGDQITHIHKGPEEPPFWHRLSRANLVLAIVVGVFSIVGAIAAVLAVPGLSDYIYNFFRPLPFPPATHEETLIVIATFHHTEGVADTDAHNEIRQAIEVARDELDLPNLRVEVEPTRLTSDDQDEARKLGEQYRASMIIWGADTGVRVTVNFLSLKEPDYGAASVKISETERTQLVDPPAYAQFITNDLPAQLTFLALLAVGWSYYLQTNYLQGIRVIEKAVAALPQELDSFQGKASAYFTLGLLYHGQGQYDQAIVACTKAIELNFDPLIWPYINRGLAYSVKGSYDQAIADYNRAIELSSKVPAAYYNRGLTYAEQGDYQRAIADYDKAIVLDPKSANVYINRAIAYHNVGNSKQGVVDFKKAIELSQDNADFLSSICWKGSLLGYAVDVIAVCERAVQLAPDKGYAHGGRALARALTGDRLGAIEDFKFASKWWKENYPDAKWGSLEEKWIAELEAGQNPFNEATLEALRRE